MLQIPNRTAQLCLKNHSSTSQFSGFSPLPFLSLTMSCPVVPFLFSQISISFLNSFNWLLSCSRLFFVVGLFGIFVLKKKNKTKQNIEKANSGSSFHFHFGLQEKTHLKAAQLPGTKHWEVALQLPLKTAEKLVRHSLLCCVYQ